MVIIIDYDNDEIRLGTEVQIYSDSKEVIHFKKVDNLKMFEQILSEILNFQVGENDRSVSLQKQDEGQITTIEEY